MSEISNLLHQIYNNGIWGIDFLNIIIFIINLLILICGKWIIKYIDSSDLQKKPDEISKKQKLKTLQFINAILAGSYILALFLDKGVFQHIILSGFSILVIYILHHLSIRYIVKFYGKEIEINGETFFQKSPTSEIFGLVLHILSIIIGLIIILNIFNLNSWFQTGGIIGGLLAFTGFTANQWAPDIVAGLQLLHSKRIKHGDVLKIPELNNKEVWVKTISLTEVKLIDLVTENGIVIRTSKFRDYNIENISIGTINEDKNTFIQYIDLKIGYGTDADKVEELCINVFNTIETRINEYIDTDNNILNQKYKLLKRAFNGKKDCYVEIIDNGDHAVVYRFFYLVHNAKSIIKIRNMLNKELYKQSEKEGIGLNTPFTLLYEK